MSMRRALGGVVVLVAVAWATLAGARSATVKDRARLRAEPGATGELRSWLPAGTQVELLRESGGWYEIQSPMGSGYVWGEHLAMEGSPAPAAEGEGGGAPPPPAGSSVLDEVRALREEVRALREQPAATAADLERLRADVERALGTAHDTTHGDRPPTVLGGRGDPPPPESLVSVAPVLLIVGGIVGWVTSRLFQRRRDGRQRNRLRL
jgi:Bacterial SH3 domain